MHRAHISYLVCFFTLNRWLVCWLSKFQHFIRLINIVKSIFLITHFIALASAQNQNNKWHRHQQTDTFLSSRKFHRQIEIFSPRFYVSNENVLIFFFSDEVALLISSNLLFVCPISIDTKSSVVLSVVRKKGRN